MTHPYDDLIQRIKSAPPDERRPLIDELVTQFAEAAHHWALVILEDESAAHDAVQEAWLSAYLHLDQLRESAAFPGWFRQIVITSSHHAIRGEKPDVPLSEETSSIGDPTQEVEALERKQRVREAVQALPDHERVVTELFYFGDVSQQEIAETLAVPVTTVKKRLQYARQRLKAMIQPDIMASLYGIRSPYDTHDDDDLALGDLDLWEIGQKQIEWSPVVTIHASSAYAPAIHWTLITPKVEAN